MQCAAQVHIDPDTVKLYLSEGFEPIWVSLVMHNCRFFLKILVATKIKIWLTLSTNSDS